jgi:hypothetical protein
MVIEGRRINLRRNKIIRSFYNFNVTYMLAHIINPTQALAERRLPVITALLEPLGDTAP